MRSMVEGAQPVTPPPARFARHFPRSRGRSHSPPGQMHRVNV
jgi:hypothetical protein